MSRSFDPIELELLWRRLISAVDEAAVAMVRTSFSTLVRESYDFSCVITDAAGQSLVQASESIPSFIGTLPETLTEPAVRAEFEAAYKALFARTPPGANIQFVALRLSVTAPMPGTGGKLELPRHASTDAEKGTRPVFFPDQNKTVQTKVWDRYALQPGVTIDGPAVFEEDESTFIVGPNATAHLLSDGSILAEAN